MTLVITIPGRPPTPNARGNPNLQWRRAQQWRAESKTRATEQRPPDWHPLHRCRLRIEFVVATKAHRDWDNLIASTKPLTDGLKDAGILADDTSEVIAELAFAITYQRGVQATVYHLEALELEQIEAAL